MYDIGIIGGMGPKATSKLFEMIVDYTDAKSDQEHPSILIVNDSKTPDRTDYLLEKSETSPIDHLIESIKLLNSTIKKDGAIGMACNTAHFFYDSLSSICTSRFINMPSETLDYISKSSLNKNVCVLGTLGTIETDVYKKYSPDNISITYPDDERKNEIQKIIYQVKDTANVNYEECATRFANLMKNIGNYTFVLACTELSILDKHFFTGLDVIDAMEILALSLIVKAGHKADFSKVMYEKSRWSKT